MGRATVREAENLTRLSTGKDRVLVAILRRGIEDLVHVVTHRRGIVAASIATDITVCIDEFCGVL